VILGAFAFLLLGVGTILATADRVAASGTCFVVALLLILMTQLDRLEFFKGFGVEARIRKLDETLDRAEEMRVRLQSVTLVTAELAMQMICRIGYMAGPLSRGESYRFFRQYERQLRELGASEDHLETVFGIHTRRVGYELLLPVDSELRQLLQSGKEAGLIDSADLEEYVRRLDSLMSETPNFRTAAYGELLSTLHRQIPPDRIQSAIVLRDRISEAGEWLSSRRLRREERYLAEDPHAV